MRAYNGINCPECGAGMVVNGVDSDGPYLLQKVKCGDCGFKMVEQHTLTAAESDDEQFTIVRAAERTAILLDETGRELFRGAPSDLPVRFRDESGDLVVWSMSLAVENGTPIDAESGDNLELAD